MPLVSRIDEFLSSSTLSYRLKQIHPSRRFDQLLILNRLIFRRFGGLILIKFGARIELIIFHNTKHFAFAYCTSNFTIKRYIKNRTLPRKLLILGLNPQLKTTIQIPLILNSIHLPCDKCYTF